MLTSPFAFADDDPAFFFQLSAGPSTYKSELVSSNDTSFLTGFAFGINGGSAKDLTMLLRYDTSTTGFVYADSTLKSSIATTFQDTVIRYSLGPFYLGGIFGRSEVVSSLKGEKYLNSLATGYGFNGGLQFDTTKGGGVVIDIASLTMTNTIDGIQDPNAVKVSVGARMDIYVGGTLRLGKGNFHLYLGYMQRSLALKAATSAAEVQTATIAGLGMSVGK